MKKAFAAFGVLSAALVLMVAPVSAQTPADIKATITTAPASPTAGAAVNATTQFSIPVLSGTGATVSVTSSAAPVTLVSFTPGLSSCLTTGTSVTCTWSTPDPASPQTIVISVPGAGTSMTFTAAAGSAGQLTQKATATVTVGAATTTTVAGSTTTGATTTAAATTTVAPPPTDATIATTVAPTTTAAGTLPATGTNSNAPLMIAIVAIALGAVLLGATRLVRSRS